MDPDTERRIRAGYEAFQRGDLEATLRDFSGEPSFVAPDYALESGEREGRDAVAAAFQSVHDWMELDTIEPEELVEGPEGILVMARVRGRGRASGIPVDELYAHVLRYAGGRVQRFNWFETRAEGLAAIGLADPPAG